MVSSSEGNGNSIDSSVGGLVWVRRRNGSWWPGRILGHDELPDTYLFSKRSGTPVKLLGREDASVDWYNFEKSKRVKPFRCGEFDDCIKKAKFTSIISGKRTVKYARREGAILHALELEKTQLSLCSNNKNNNDNNNNNTNTNNNTSPETRTTSDIATSSISISPPELPCAASSPDKQCAPNDSEEDGAEGSKKRMRGLEDLGIGRAVSSFKKRRSQVVHAHGCLRKKDRRRQLSKVLKKPDMLSIPVMCEKITNISVKLEGEEYNGVKGSSSDSTGDVTNNGESFKRKENGISSDFGGRENGDSSARLFNVPYIREEKKTAGSSPGLVSGKPQVNSGVQSGQSSHIETISTAQPEEIQESASISSKWQQKGKRNSRRKKTKSIQNFFDTTYILDDKSTKVNFGEAPQRLMPCRLSRFTVNPKFHSSDFSYDKIETVSLYEVDIEVQVGHFPHHVPYMSLLSKLTGQPITGHKLAVEVLKDSVSDVSFSGSCELDEVNKVREASRKIRRLSSLTESKRLDPASSLTCPKRLNQTDLAPDLACIPLKVVFGRLNAVLGII